mmetsp:Transcript_2322/g.5832  ORF Transcript_2322/g.5832 Transcript_2322/m.5832 type:complete len:325 (-) Transcript_2322:938-1912(-)
MQTAAHAAFCRSRMDQPCSLMPPTACLQHGAQAPASQPSQPAAARPAAARLHAAARPAAAAADAAASLPCASRASTGLACSVAHDRHEDDIKEVGRVEQLLEPLQHPGVIEGAILRKQSPQPAPACRHLLRGRADADHAHDVKRLEQPALDVVLVPFVRAAAAALRRVCDVPVVVAWAFASAVPKRKAVDVDAGAHLACHLDSHQPAGGRVPALEDQPCGLLETGAEGGHQGNSMPDDPAGAEQQLVVRVRLLHLLAQCLKMLCFGAGGNVGGVGVPVDEITVVPRVHLSELVVQQAHIRAIAHCVGVLGQEGGLVDADDGVVR